MPLAKELDVVLPLSFFERAGNAFFNSIAVVDADGTLAGHYRKSHIPDGPGYTEKFYFSPGDTGFQAIKTKYATVGALVCWDQWFPEAARCTALLGADILFYPSAIGSEPQDPSINSYSHWIRTMLGHAAANVIPVVACNRVGTETVGVGEQQTKSHITFYGGSFIAGPTGEVVAQVGGSEEALTFGFPDPCPDKRLEGVAVATFDLDEIRVKRVGWGLFRDRRPDLYGPVICTLDGRTNARLSG